ncbi:hypothetical protein DRO97_07470 [Archaeoglobales archaeon]|nr:MAG: hypothetical protein DRO97_07470 [Archaeoglobales archaeon]
MTAPYQSTGKGIGVCAEETLIVDSISKSLGVSTLPISVYWRVKIGDREWYNGHGHVIYFDGAHLWGGYPKQIYIDLKDANKQNSAVDVYFLLPPINQDNYVKSSDPPNNVAVPYPYFSKEINPNMYVLMYKRVDNLDCLKSVTTQSIKKLMLYARHN